MGVIRCGALVGVLVVVIGLLAGCSGSKEQAAGPDADVAVTGSSITEPSTTTTTAPPTTTSTVPPTTAPPPTQRPTTTTTLDEATRRFYEQFGGPREAPTPLPDPHATQSSGSCTVVAGGFGVDGHVDWSDGYREVVSAPGPYAVSAAHVATGARGSTADIVITGPHSCVATVHDPSQGP